VLRKLGVGSRGRAVSEAGRLGLGQRTDPDREVGRPGLAGFR